MRKRRVTSQESYSSGRDTPPIPGPPATATPAFHPVSQAGPVALSSPPAIAGPTALATPAAPAGPAALGGPPAAAVLHRIVKITAVL